MSARPMLGLASVLVFAQTGCVVLHPYEPPPDAAAPSGADASRLDVGADTGLGYGPAKPDTQPSPDATTLDANADVATAPLGACDWEFDWTEQACSNSICRLSCGALDVACAVPAMGLALCQCRVNGSLRKSATIHSELDHDCADPCFAAAFEAYGCAGEFGL